MRDHDWITNIKHCIHQLDKKEFTLAEVYKYEEWLKERYPENNNVKAKIRQQLQKLRDCGFLLFVGNGVYRLK